jgi:KUP system potassium uptake protein
MSDTAKAEAPSPEGQSKEAAKEPPPAGAGARGSHSGPLWPVAITALGIVYGDIGTSPLYAIKECFNGAHAVAATEANVLGVLSLVFWSLTIVVAIKYLGFILRANNKGEGGIFALMALIPHKLDQRSEKIKPIILMLAVFGAALLYGDGIITPAITVLSAVEGLNVATKAAENWVVPITVGVLIGLFMVQHRGTRGIGRVFGPVMLLWFAAISILGLRYIVRDPDILRAINPYWGVQFFMDNSTHGFTILGSVVLCITGAEALYADMGHFGPRPIRASWFAFVFPALLLNYFGQGGLLLENMAAGVLITPNPFYGIVPQSLTVPMVILATAAAVIASQAMISGAFSLTRQAVALGYCPRVTIVHTSERDEGQIYVPEVNQALMVACVGLVLFFQESSRLAAAYGIAVTGTMCATSIVYYFMVTRNWGWSAWRAAPLVMTFLFFELSFFSSSMLKVKDGGWFPLVMGLAIFTLMTTWKRGRNEIGQRFIKQSMPLEALLDDLTANPPHRVRGTAIFMSGSPTGTPPVLLHHLKHNQILHRQVVLFSIVPADMPVVPREEQIAVTDCGQGFFRVVAHSGFMQTPNVPWLLKECRHHGLVCEPSTTSYYLGRETLLTNGKSKMMKWRKILFAFVSRNALPATSYFGIPAGRVVELGMQMDL